jgi:hypothetical protein
MSMRMFTEHGQPRSPLDEIPGLEDASQLQAEIEARLGPKLAQAREQYLRDYHEGRERLRHVILN